MTPDPDTDRSAVHAQPDSLPVPRERLEKAQRHLESGQQRARNELPSGHYCLVQLEQVRQILAEELAKRPQTLEVCVAKTSDPPSSNWPPGSRRWLRKAAWTLASAVVVALLAKYGVHVNVPLLP